MTHNFSLVTLIAVKFVEKFWREYSKEFIHSITISAGFQKLGNLDIERLIEVLTYVTTQRREMHTNLFEFDWDLSSHRSLWTVDKPVVEATLLRLNIWLRVVWPVWVWACVCNTVSNITNRSWQLGLLACLFLLLTSVIILSCGPLSVLCKPMWL